ncbi:MAG TPA: hypothetical protein VJ999_07985 [Candidatus Sulfotelmatobacter sp.]|nr:hypothetical protein [Candidatus Sulfotelmatobacter sp.]
MTSKMLALILLTCAGSSLLAAQALPNETNVLLRRYRAGEKLTYSMKGINEDRHYEIQADGIVIKDSAGTYFEEYRWSNLISDNQKTALPPASRDFRQQVTLDPNHSCAFPNLSQVDHRLIGPITDLMSFYADLRLAVRTGKLAHPGDHFCFKRSAPNSWADGTHVLIGEDAIDFDLTLKDVNRSDNTATLVVRHVPPEKPEIKLTVDWMRKPVADTANNWVQVQRAENGKYLAAVGKETFDVEIKLSLADGKILSGTLDNPVETVERECEDAALTRCGDPRPHPIRRQIEISSGR